MRKEKKGNERGRAKKLDTHRLNHSHSIIPPLCKPPCSLLRGSFYWTHNRTNEHMCHLIISTDAGKEAVMLPARCQESHSQTDKHTNTCMLLFSASAPVHTEHMPLPRLPRWCKSPADRHNACVRAEISLFPSSVWKKKS